MSKEDTELFDQRETFESVFMGLPNCCILKTPNNYHKDYTCVYKYGTRASISANGATPRQAVVKLAELLAIAFKNDMSIL